MTARDRRPSTLLGSAVMTYGANLGVALLQLANALVVARSLGTTGRGDVALLMAIPLIMSQLATLSVQEATANIGGSEPERRSALATNAIVLAVVLGGAAALLVVGLEQVAPAIAGDVDRRLLLVSLAAIPCLVAKLTLQFLLQSDYRFAVTNVAWLTGPLVSTVVNGVMALTGGLTVTSAIVTWTAGQLLGALILVISARSAFGFARFDGALARRCLRFGMRTHVGRLMDVGSYRMDQWFVGSMVGSHELGLYSVAVSWAEVLFYVPGVIVLVQRPDLVRVNPAAAADIAARVFRRCMLLAAVVGAALLVAAPLLCVTTFGPEFAGSVPMLRLLAIGALGVGALELLTNVLVAQRRPWMASLALGCGFAATVVLDLVLIPIYGGRGAAIATTVAYSVGGIVAMAIFLRVLPGPARALVPRRDDVAWYGRKASALLVRLRPGTSV